MANRLRPSRNRGKETSPEVPAAPEPTQDLQSMLDRERDLHNRTIETLEEKMQSAVAKETALQTLVTELREKQMRTQRELSLTVNELRTAEKRLTELNKQLSTKEKDVTEMVAALHKILQERDEQEEGLFKRLSRTISQLKAKNSENIELVAGLSAEETRLRNVYRQMQFDNSQLWGKEIAPLCSRVVKEKVAFWLRRRRGHMKKGNTGTS